MARPVPLARVNKNLHNKTEMNFIGKRGSRGFFLFFSRLKISLHSTELTANKNVIILKENHEKFPYFLARTTTGNQNSRDVLLYNAQAIRIVRKKPIRESNNLSLEMLYYQIS